MAAIANPTMITIRNTADALFNACFEGRRLDLDEFIRRYDADARGVRDPDIPRELYVPDVLAEFEGFTVLHAFMTKLAFRGYRVLPPIENVHNVVAYLVSKGLDPNTGIGRRSSPALIAARIPDEKYAINIVNILVGAGAQLECVNNKSMNIVDAMKLFGERRPVVEEYLKSMILTTPAFVQS